LALLLALGSPPARPAEQTPGQILGGSADAPVRIEVFSDFQCPSCRELYLGVMRQVLREYSGRNRVCVIYHEFPLSIHRYAREAARYSEAASRLGRPTLLKVFDSLFMDQAQWSQDGRLGASVSRALSRAEFQQLMKIMQEPGINTAIEEQIRLGEQKQIQKTPTFIIYSARKQERVEGLLTYVSLKQYIDSVLK
jgi:protein-disulfide isomerase